ncbi:hypothetical protein [Lentibacter sp. XHP0401]|uniref:hypothetical protein n=1 Tax=Lentibacter sp. XHP0401 TaxID=2984334 RepID=UPI0021E7F88B|nr:hypothetical protein [Lentibacter sp. XHP0401]MCV2893896.1 hypothetical protein [Lentibacter sp. XHP0401]
MSSIESLGIASQSRAAYTPLLHERQAQSQNARASASKVELPTAVSQTNASDTSRLRLESRPKEAPPPRKLLLTGNATAAYLIEMRLTQEIAMLQEEQKTG